MKKGAVVLGFVLLVLAAWPVVAQSPAEIDRILAAERLRYEDAAYLLMGANGSITPNEAPAAALAALERQGLGLRPQSAVEGLTVGEFSLLAMRVFRIKGGIAYTLLALPRYAARELAFRGVIQGQLYPRAPISGESALRTVGRILALQEGGKL